MRDMVPFEEVLELSELHVYHVAAGALCGTIFVVFLSRRNNLRSGNNTQARWIAARRLYCTTCRVCCPATASTIVLRRASKTGHGEMKENL